MSNVYYHANHPPRAMLPGAGAERERFREAERRERHFPKFLGSGASRERFIYIYIYIFLYIYCIYIKKKHVERQISCRIYDIMKTCTFVH